jgi:hypothetical protein
MPTYYSPTMRIAVRFNSFKKLELNTQSVCSRLPITNCKPKSKPDYLFLSFCALKLSYPTTYHDDGSLDATSL